MMSASEQRAANRARLNVYRHKLVRQPEYHYLKWLARMSTGEQVLRRWRDYWAKREAQRAFARWRRGGAA